MEVEKDMVRLVMVEVELFKTTVPKPLAMEPDERAPVEVREEETTAEPREVPERTGVPLMEYHWPLPMFTEPVKLPPPAVVVPVPTPRPPVR